MSSLTVSLIALIVIFGSAVVGMLLRKILPDQHTGADSRALVMIGTGLVGTMAALVLGLLVSGAKDSYDAQKNNLTALSAKVILLDRVLAHYGSEAAAVRVLLRQACQQELDRTWPQENRLRSGFSAPTRGTEALYDEIVLLSPANENQTAARQQAISLALDLGQVHWLMFEQQESTRVPSPFLIIMIFWFTIIFVSFGLYTEPNPTIVITLLLCALSVAGATFLILSMYQPFQGLLQISSAPLRGALKHLGQ